MRILLRHFIVEGAGEFPLDMLRYDEAFPAAESQSHLLLSSPKRRQVSLFSCCQYSPCVGRWKSFGWKVVEIEGKKYEPKEN